MAKSGSGHFTPSHFTSRRSRCNHAAITLRSFHFPCTGQESRGAVLAMKTSVILCGQAAVTRYPVSGSMSAVTMSEGTGKFSAKYWDGTERENFAKIGTAACEPERFKPRLSS